jgi:hypothetical protein
MTKVQLDKLRKAAQDFEATGTGDYQRAEAIITNIVGAKPANRDVWAFIDAKRQRPIELNLKDLL